MVQKQKLRGYNEQYILVAIHVENSEENVYTMTFYSHSVWVLHSTSNWGGNMCIVETKNVTILFLQIRIFRKKKKLWVFMHINNQLCGVGEGGFEGTVATNEPPCGKTNNVVSDQV